MAFVTELYPIERRRKIPLFDLSFGNFRLSEMKEIQRKSIRNSVSHGSCGGIMEFSKMWKSWQKVERAKRQVNEWITQHQKGMKEYESFCRVISPQ